MYLISFFPPIYRLLESWTRQFSESVLSCCPIWMTLGTIQNKILVTLLTLRACNCRILYLSVHDEMSAKYTSMQKNFRFSYNVWVDFVGGRQSRIITTTQHLKAMKHRIYMKITSTNDPFWTLSFKINTIMPTTLLSHGQSSTFHALETFFAYMA